MTTQSGRRDSVTIHAGFMPLVDCAPLIIAKELGFDRAEGIKLELHKEASWSNVRDKVIVGQFDCAHMLAPMPLAASLGINHVREAVMTPLTLSLNGNAITVSKAVDAHMRDVSAGRSRSDPLSAGRALAAVIAERQRKSSGPLTFAVVFPFSCQHYELRDWLASSGVDLDRDIRLVGLPPSMMADSLAAGKIDGFCAGEPWNSAAVQRNAGVIAVTKSELWRLAPEKVLGVRLEWAEREADALFSLVRAVLNGMNWLGDADHHQQAAELLSAERYLDVDSGLVLGSISNRIVRVPDKAETHVDAFLKFPDLMTSAPSRLHAAWVLAMMVKSGQMDAGEDYSYIVDQVARVDLWETATGRNAGETIATDAAVRQAVGSDSADLGDFIAAVRNSV